MATCTGFACVVAWFVVGMQVLFGAIEILKPDWAAEKVLGNKYIEPSRPIWLEPVRNLGLYNWFLAFGLLLTLVAPFGGVRVAQFFVGCVAVAGAFGLGTVGFSIAFIFQFGVGSLALLLLLLL